MIEVRELTKNFARHAAVRGIDFHVARGEIVGFLGPNGAGKTTTLRMLTGYLPASSGSARVAGFDIFRESLEARRRIGYMPENVPLYDDMRVREYLKYRAALKGLSPRDTRRRVNEVIDTCGLEGVHRKMIKVLSKGYRQRVGLADALVHEPELLIFDEPTNGLDPNQIRQIRDLIKRLSEKHTILLSTHILHEVEMTCGRVIIIDGGVIKAQDTPQNLVAGMRAAGRIHAEIAGDPEVIAPAIQRLDHIKRVTATPLEETWAHYEVLVDSGIDARETIHELVAQYGWPLRSLHRKDATLEDVFVELTRRD
ncbi:MAG: ATP-binding cassette domain-containing protein [Verrucomicrobia bacterium]|nr:MAG: ATP-binding cassette domain-containing protein [Verrucomicrobiota bacterium]TAE85806.1 MAG: ATP-binding cassette domain-containing protein [Verrucomicrobiota bacterium]TAF23227.1 MAG: ATP-binding cassette domain-containing protein [Verrucomicrobiota bacterium]TAF40056.1 MAG: ATP-binding cassette domain-containing protein [Verrucomicrobiota bacterium]